MTPFTTEELNDLREKVKDVKFGMLTTSDDMRALTSRPLTLQELDEDGNMGAGGRQPFTPGLQGLMPQLPQQAADRVSAVLENHRANLMFQPGVMGVGVGLSNRAEGEGAIIIYVNKDAGNKPFLPESIEGIPVNVILTDQFVAF